MVLDEIGYRPCTRQSADLLYNIISRRHENRSLVLTTNQESGNASFLAPAQSAPDLKARKNITAAHYFDGFSRAAPLLATSGAF